MAQGRARSGTRARAYELGLQVAARYGLRGVFLHSWASEPDQLGPSTAVEAMLRRVWGRENN